MSQSPPGEAVLDAGTGLTRAGSLRRMHGLIGVCTLGGYSVLHVVQGYAVFAGREAWVDRVSLFPLAKAATWIAIAGLLAHAVTGVLLARSSDDPTALIEPEGAAGLRRVQQVTGLVLLAFVIAHVVQLSPLTHHDPVLARQGYVALCDWLETPLGLLVYVIATTALAFHLAHGVARLCVSLGWVADPSGLRAARWVTGALGLLLWCATLQWVGQLANGVGVWPITGEDDPMPADMAEPPHSGDNPPQLQPGSPVEDP